MCLAFAENADPFTGQSDQVSECIVRAGVPYSLDSNDLPFWRILVGVGLGNEQPHQDRYQLRSVQELRCHLPAVTTDTDRSFIRTVLRILFVESQTWP